MSLLAELRSSTREVHDRLETRLDVLGRCRRPGGYAALLAGFWSVYHPLEQAVSACPATVGAVPDWSHRSKTAWLEQDLADLSVPLPPTAPAPTLVSAADVVGTVYVMEGATLGGRLVERELDGMPTPPPHRFFTGYAERRGAMWHAFRSHVDVLDAGGLDGRRVVDAARRTFEAVERACVPEAS